ncbi:CHAP domain-containing protein [Cellulomonas alba]|uniref:CHAP domain-containing protein n=1 Tax=Cellulomonas alba TaxID=3053467 RepID=A0ABT7SCZ7_9CELL|nr:CHAP domain-containing protein [Cellulomonas alba]MDM7854045.1 CHAP domain-containing protein [Cellulomonas alba]
MTTASRAAHRHRMRALAITAALALAALVGETVAAGPADAAGGAGSRASAARLSGGVEAAVVAAAPAAVPAATSATARVVTATATPAAVIRGEQVLFQGSVKAGGTAVVGVTVQLVRRVSATAREVLGYAVTSSSGGYSIAARPAVAGEYYTRVLASGSTPGAHGPVLPVRLVGGNRTLDQRAQLLGSRLGAATAGISTLSASARAQVGDPAVTRVRTRTYQKGQLVEVTRSGVVRTWLVASKIRSRVVAKGGVTGVFGVPMQDARCGLLESGCIQQFSKVAAYQSSTVASAHYQHGRGGAAQYLATARAQLGYREPAWRKSKYNTWVGGHLAWCSVFQSWVAAGSGQPGAVPKRATFPSFVKAVKAQLRTYSRGSSKPHAGTLVIYDLATGGRGAPTHAGVVISLTKTTVTAIEGNSSTGLGFTDKRGVYVHTRARSAVVLFAEPAW